MYGTGTLSFSFSIKHLMGSTESRYLNMLQVGAGEKMLNKCEIMEQAFVLAHF